VARTLKSPELVHLLGDLPGALENGLDVVCSGKRRVDLLGQDAESLTGEVPQVVERCPLRHLQAKLLQDKEAAKRWANHFTADATVGTTWRYLLASESDVETAKGSWPALQKLGS
jgi:hypothetical protein